jgi:hypothetical protein
MTEFPADDSALPNFDLVIEWENARLSELSLAQRMLQAVDGQVAALKLAYRPTAWIVYDSDEIDPAVISEAIQQTLPPPYERAIQFQLRGARGQGYYELKNFGASLCEGDVVVFLDSDVVPERNWLHLLLRTIADPSVQVVGGAAYIEPLSLYSKAFALFWFFPLRDERAGARSSRSFYANNVAFRRSVFVSHQYPNLPNFRGQCYVLARSLISEGITIMRRCDARVVHPPPNGAKHFVLRALAHGHDDVADALRRGDEDGQQALRYLAMLPRQIRASAHKISANQVKLGLNVVESAASLALATIFETIRCAGAVYSCRNPRGIRRVVRV